MGTKMARQLWGRDFDIVKEGLDESQVAMFITELIGERDELLQRQDHLASLTKLAERTIAEADKLAADIKKEVEEKSQAQAAMILAKAEKEAQELMEQKRTEILDVANKEAQAVRAEAQQEAEAIKARAKQEVERLLSQQQQRVQRETKEMAQKLHGQLLAGLKDITEHAVALRGEWESKLSESVEVGLSPEIVTSSSPSETVAEAPIEETVAEAPIEETVAEAPIEETVAEAPIEEETIVDTPEAEVQAETEAKAENQIEAETGAEAEAVEPKKNNIFEQLEQAWGEPGIATTPAENSEVAPVEMTSQMDEETVDQTTVALDESSDSANYEGRVELNILPPLAPNQLVEIQRYLRDWPGVGIIELGPSSDGYSITLSLDKPMPLLDILKQLPAIEDAREKTDSGDGRDGAALDKKGLRKIAITICRTK
jgi:hypothetical protein